MWNVGRLIRTIRNLAQIRGIQLRQVFLSGRSEWLLPRGNLRHSKTEVWLPCLRVSVLGGWKIKRLIHTYLFRTDDPRRFSNSGGRPLLQILRWPFVFDGQDVFVVGPGSRWRSFGRAAGEACLARETWLERRCRGSDKEEGRLLGNRYSRGVGRCEENPFE